MQEHLMSFIISDDKQQPSYENEERIIGDITIPKNTTTETFKELGTTINFIDFWIKIFHHNYEVKWKNFK